tara:strand:- start:406 stop:720 length:315 start_codon:yes stop_codon:yes gene_type:complete
MGLVSKVVQCFKGRRYIKIAGVASFDQLERDHIPALIEAFLDGENDQFEDGAFVEFLHWDLKKPHMLAIQGELNGNSFLTPEPGLYPEVNEPFLRDFLESFERD